MFNHTSGVLNFDSPTASFVALFRWHVPLEVEGWMESINLIIEYYDFKFSKSLTINKIISLRFTFGSKVLVVPFPGLTSESESSASVDVYMIYNVNVNDYNVQWKKILLNKSFLTIPFEFLTSSVQRQLLWQQHDPVKNVILTCYFKYSLSNKFCQP